MSKLSISLKLGTPKKNKVFYLKNADFLSLDVNGRSYSPENLEENPYVLGIELKDHSLKFDYESRKFKVRSPSNFIKTAQNWNNMPYQRIRNVEKAIQIQKKKESFILSDRGATILPEFDHFSPSTSPRTTEKGCRIKDQLKMYNQTERKRLKEIEETIAKSRQENKEQQNIIKFQEKIRFFESKEFVSNEIINTNNLNHIDRLESKRDYRKEEVDKSKGTLYAYMVKNRRKLSERRHTKKKSADYSLLGRINYLQEQQNDQSFILRNSLNRVKFSEELKRFN